MHVVKYLHSFPPTHHESVAIGLSTEFRQLTPDGFDMNTTSFKLTALAISCLAGIELRAQPDIGMYPSTSFVSTNILDKTTAPPILRNLTAPMYVNTVVGMESLSNASTPGVVIALGFALIADGGGGLYVYSASLPAWSSATNLLCIAASGGGYWVAQFVDVDIRRTGGFPNDSVNDIAALRAIVTNGLPAYLPAGIYDIDDIENYGGYIDNPPYVSIRGAGRDTTIIQAADVVTPSNPGWGALVINDTTPATVPSWKGMLFRDFTIKTKGALSTAGPYQLLAINGQATNVVVSNIRFNGGKTAAFRAYNVVATSGIVYPHTKVIIENCVFDNAVDTASGLTDGGAILSPWVQDWKIVNCSFMVNNIDQRAHAIYLGSTPTSDYPGGRDIIISGCVFRGTQGDISLLGNQNIIVENNILATSAKVAGTQSLFDIENAFNVTITGNLVTNTILHLANSTNVVSSGNIFHISDKGLFPVQLVSPVNWNSTGDSIGNFDVSTSGGLSYCVQVPSGSIMRASGSRFYSAKSYAFYVIDAASTGKIYLDGCHVSVDEAILRTQNAGWAGEFQMRGGSLEIRMDAPFTGFVYEPGVGTAPIVINNVAVKFLGASGAFMYTDSGYWPARQTIGPLFVQGGAAASRLPGMYAWNVAPESVVTAVPGSLLLDDAGKGWLKGSGTTTTGWVDLGRFHGIGVTSPTLSLVPGSLWISNAVQTFIYSGTAWIPLNTP